MQNWGKLVLWPLNSYTHIEDINRGRDFVSWIFMECHWSVVRFSPACHKLRMSQSFTKPSERSFNWIKWVLQWGHQLFMPWQIKVFSGSRTAFEKYLHSPLSTGQRCLYPRLWILIWCYLKSDPAQESFLPWDGDLSSKELLGVPPAVRSWGGIGRDLFAEGDTSRSFAIGGSYPWKNAYKLPKRGKIQL